MREPDLQRLFRAAAEAPDHDPAEMPFGFDTRVLAHWRAQRSGDGAEQWDLARLVRRIALGAVLVTACAGSAAWWQVQENDELDSPTSNAYAIADSAIAAGSWQ